MEKNTITVSKNRNESKDISLENMNWISNPPEKNKKYTARVRHLGKRTPISFDSGKIIFDTPVTVATGQSLVVYDGDVCLGGGIVA